MLCIIYYPIINLHLHEDCPESKDTSLIEMQGKIFFMVGSTTMSPSICMMRYNSPDLMVITLCSQYWKNI